MPGEIRILRAPPLDILRRSDMRILGIDPGSLVTGFGVVERTAKGLIHVAHGTIEPRRGVAMSERLAVIHRELEQVLEQHRPDRAVIERVFVAASPRAALVLGQARGAALAALGAAGIPVAELAAREIKKAVVGTGSATKQQVQMMVAELLGLASKPAPDAADALAGAICHANANRLAELGVVPRARGRARSRRSSARARFTLRRAP
jgi:crossover junction endodeoxyribonuclease RuvC